MKLFFPKSLFWRLTVLLLTVLVIAYLVLMILFRQDREALIIRNFTEAKLQQINSLRSTLNQTSLGSLSVGPDRRQILQSLGRQYDVILIPADRRPEVGEVPRGQALQRLVEKLRERLGADTEVRLGLQGDRPVVWIRLGITENGPTEAVWVGISMRSVEPFEVPMQTIVLLLGFLTLLMAGTYWFARRLSRPLSDLADAVAKVAVGERPNPLLEDGPTEIAHVARNINRMAANLERLEESRSTMLAGVSHDIRTPLMRLRLASEMLVTDDKGRMEMAADIDEIDRIVTQFLDFARGNPKSAPEVVNVNQLLARITNRVGDRAMPIELVVPDEVLLASLYPAAFERMLINLIENAYQYGAPPVSVHLRDDIEMIEIGVCDCGAGVRVEEVERLKQPFVRGDHARGGSMGAGLGLAIVERLTHWHKGEFDLLLRPEGGMMARLRLPRAIT